MIARGSPFYINTELEDPIFDFWEFGDEIPKELADGIDRRGRIYDTKDHREIIIVLPSGTSKSIIPGKHHINLIGNNPIVKEFNGVTSGEKSEYITKIRIYD